MTASSRLGLVLLIILVVWAVAYWYNVRDVTADMSRKDGVALQPMDTVGVNPDESSGSDRETPMESGSDPQPQVPEIVLPDPESEEDVNASGDNLGSTDPDTGPVEDSEIEIPPPPTTFPYVVKSGDTMESIATEWFGTRTKWVLISQENPYVDPIKLRAGDELRLPAKDASLESIPEEDLKRLTQGKSYVVTRDDTLWDIAKRFYGNGSLWRIIADANKDVLPNPDALRDGIELRIPPHQIPAE